MLPVARYRLEFDVESTVTLPAYAGSTLRGALGHALRETGSIGTNQSSGSDLMQADSAYAEVFAPPAPTDAHALQRFNQIPRPYVIEPPAWGEHAYRPGEPLAFHLVLFGRALRHLPALLFAFDRAFTKGVGRPGSRAHLGKVFSCDGERDHPILQHRADTLAEHPAHTPVLPWPSARHVRLHFDAPLRLQANGRRATADEFTPRRLLNALIRRTALLAEFHADAPLQLDFTALSAAADELHGEKKLQWRDWSRRSNTQNKRIELGGVVGTWDLRGTLDPFLPFLHLGQWLHVGKEATFGMGGYRLEVLA